MKPERLKDTPRQPGLLLLDAKSCSSAFSITRSSCELRNKCCSFRSFCDSKFSKTNPLASILLRLSCLPEAWKIRSRLVEQVPVLIELQHESERLSLAVTGLTVEVLEVVRCPRREARQLVPDGLSDFEGEDVSGVGQLEQEAEVWEEDELRERFAEEEVSGAGHASEGCGVRQVHGAAERRLQACGARRASAGRFCAGVCEQTVEQRACVAEEQRVERVEQREEVELAA